MKDLIDWQTKIYNPAAELETCDKDIQEQCEKMGTIISGVPTLMQLVKEMKELKQVLIAIKTKELCGK